MDCLSSQESEFACDVLLKGSNFTLKQWLGCPGIAKLLDMAAVAAVSGL